eukprot:4996665-Pleurochrysis_carterae.AAC.1
MDKVLARGQSGRRRCPHHGANFSQGGRRDWQRIPSRDVCRGGLGQTVMRDGAGARMVLTARSGGSSLRGRCGAEPGMADGSTPGRSDRAKLQVCGLKCWQRQSM